MTQTESRAVLVISLYTYGLSPKNEFEKILIEPQDSKRTYTDISTCVRKVSKKGKC